MSANAATGNGNRATPNRPKSARNAKRPTGKQNAPSTTKANQKPNASFDIYKCPPKKFAMFSERLYGYTLGELEDIAGIVGNRKEV